MHNSHLLVATNYDIITFTNRQILFSQIGEQKSTLSVLVKASLESNLLKICRPLCSFICKPVLEGISHYEPIRLVEYL